ncbi:MAG: formate dehydrogenase accessory sulfurtransferase FdhD [Anaerolineaceae bacterium]
MEKSHEVSFIHYADGEFTQSSAPLPHEHTLTLIVNGKAWMEMICTPSLVEELVVGFLYNEQLINTRTDITRLYLCDSADYVEVDTGKDIKKPTSWLKTTGCSGGQTSQRLEFPVHPVLNEITLSAGRLTALIKTFLEEQNRLSSSRGMHCSAIFDEQDLLAIADDIGRHNTLDKLMGQIILHNLEPKPVVLITTGRISSEMLQKAARIGTSMIVSLTSPNLFTIRLAEEWGMTLVGYARPERFNLYSHPERIIV